MAPCTVCLTFDVDAYSALVYRGQTDASSLSRGEFDVRVAVPRIMRLLHEFGLPATFFVPGHTADCFPEEIGAIAEAGHEIAHHGYCHEPPARLSADQEESALRRGIKALQTITGKPPVGYRAPLWEPSHRTLEMLQGLDFVYDSSLMGRDCYPYHPPLSDRITLDGALPGPVSSIVELPSSWVLDDWSYFANTSRAGGGGVTPPSHVYEIWSETVEYVLVNCPSSLVVFTMHPQASGQAFVLPMLHKLLTHFVTRGIRFSRMETVAEEWRSSQTIGRHSGSGSRA